MKMPLRFLIVAPLLLIGCRGDPSGDRRAAEMASRFVEQQGRQNEANARQSQEVAAASRGLVEADAQARGKMIEAHAALQRELQAERAGIDQDRRQLEQERRELALRRTRDPIVAEAIGTVGTMLACLLPLILAGYVIYVASRRSDDADVLIDYLVGELTTDQPRLPGPIRVPQLEDKSAGDPPGTSGPAGASA
jgi:hypothetical protein